jgi:PAS domain-containing protein
MSVSVLMFWCPFIQAINRSEAVIEFSMSGHVLTANKNFCDLFGYELSGLGWFILLLCLLTFVLSRDRIKASQYVCGKHISQLPRLCGFLAEIEPRKIRDLGWFKEIGEEWTRNLDFRLILPNQRLERNSMFDDFNFFSLWFFSSF